MTNEEVESRIVELQQIIRSQEVRMQPYFEGVFRRYHLLLYGAGVPNSERLKALNDQWNDYLNVCKGQMQRVEMHTAELAKLRVQRAVIRQREHRAAGGGQGRVPVPSEDPPFKWLGWEHTERVA